MCFILIHHDHCCMISRSFELVKIKTVALIVKQQQQQQQRHRNIKIKMKVFSLHDG